MSEDALDIVVGGGLAGERLDRAVALLTGLSRREVADLVTAGSVRVDGRLATVRSRALADGQRLEVNVPTPTPTGPVADATVAFGVVYEDDDVVVVDKPAGLVVHHGSGHGGGTLVDGLLARYPDLADLPPAGFGDPARPGIVHRLDKATSGLLVVARSPAAFATLSAQLRAHTAGRDYAALVVGSVASAAGVVDAPIGRSARTPTRMAVTGSGRPARTSYRIRTRYTAPWAATLLDVALATGRTHQIRVHLAAIGHPVVGDNHDGGTRARPEALTGVLAPGRVFLHAARLAFDHPDGTPRRFESALPADLQAVLDRFEA